ncbi:hypothetical protein OAI54_02120 [Pseudomonadales bacterium]|nr:hypothetical protein [Pseudomonadales bacterium]
MIDYCIARPLPMSPENGAPAPEVNLHQTLRKQLGQLVCVGFHGTTLTDPGVRKIIEQAEAGLIGGVIIYRYNIINRVQLTLLLQGIQGAKTEFPLFVFVDQEGGKIQRVDSSQGFKETLSAKRIAADLSPKAAQQHYADLGQELQAAGFNFDLAPCVDLDGDPPGPAIGQLDRSYSQDVTTVITYAQTMLEGLGSQGVLGCLKHFPGHGRARGDSHTGLLDITHTWTAAELEPFKQLVSRGVVDAVMTSHLVHQHVDAGTPVTFSTEWLRILREDLGFDGVIVADDLHMGAVIRHYTLNETVVQGLTAGLDLLMFSNNPLAAQPQGIRHDLNATMATVSTGAWVVADPDLPAKVIFEATKAVVAGQLTEGVINAAYERVIELKRKLVRLQADTISLRGELT